MSNYLEEFEEKWIRERKALEYKIYVWSGSAYTEIIRSVRISYYEVAFTAAQEWSERYAKDALVKVCIEHNTKPLALFLNGKQITEDDDA